MYDISIGTEVVETWHKYFREYKIGSWNMIHINEIMLVLLIANVSHPKSEYVLINIKCTYVWQ